MIHQIEELEEMHGPKWRYGWHSSRAVRSLIICASQCAMAATHVGGCGSFADATLGHDNIEFEKLIAS